MRGQRVEYAYNHTHIFALMREAILFKTLCPLLTFSLGFLMGLLLRAGAKLTKHNCKSTAKCTTVLVWSFPKASVIVFSLKAVHI